MYTSKCCAVAYFKVKTKLDSLYDISFLKVFLTHRLLIAPNCPLSCTSIKQPVGHPVMHLCEK